MKDLFAGIVSILTLAAATFASAGIYEMATCFDGPGDISSCGALAVIPLFILVTFAAILPLQIRAFKHFKQRRVVQQESGAAIILGDTIMYWLSLMGLVILVAPVAMAILLAALGAIYSPIYYLFMI